MDNPTRTFLITLFLFATSARGQEDPPPAPEIARKTLEEWVETKRLASQENADWQAERATLAELNAIRKREVEQLSAFIEAAGDRVAEIEEKRQQHADEESELKAWRAQLESSLDGLEERLRIQIDRFPPPLAAKTAEAGARIRNPDSERPLQHRTRDLLLVLQAWIEFQNLVTVDGEVRDIDGEKREIDVLYLGTTRAWFVDRSGTRAGFGEPSQDGWTWTRDDSLASRIRQAIDIRRRQAPPALVELPLGGAGDPSASSAP